MSDAYDAVRNNLRVVVAIDFGTARSGYAYAFVDDKEIFGETLWEGQSVPYPKTLTEILYNPDRTAIAWGYMARHKLASLPFTDAKDYSLLRNFKMDLHQGQVSTAGPAVRTTSSGQKLSIQDVIATYLKLLKDKALERIKKTSGNQLRNDEFLWCLTVPAIWSDYEKNVMRHAARQAGIIDQHDSERLLLALEPEAAAIYCQEKEQFQLTSGQRFMIVDCGGGTVDITTHEVIGSNLKEIVVGTGGALGSTYLDAAFRRYLDARLGKAALDDFEKSESLSYIDMMSRWERVKCEFGKNKETSVTYFPFEVSLFNLLRKKHPNVLKKLEDEQDGEDTRLLIDLKAIEGIFDPVVNQIIRQVRQEISKMGSRGCDALLLVGGFSESPYLQKKIRDNFTNSVRRILIPPNPSSAIVQGAVSFGLNPSKIRARCSRLTYGCKTRSEFIPGTDPEAKKCWSDGNPEPRCEDVFSVFVTAGQLISENQSVTQRYVPTVRGQKSMEFSFYATRKTKVRHVDEPSVEKIGEFIVEMPDLTGDLNRTIECTMNFGGTEIKVHAKDLTSGKTARTTLRFSSTYSPETLRT